MNRPLPNTTAEAVGFTIPGRSSSLQYDLKLSSKHKKKEKKKKSLKGSLEESHHEVAERMRSLSLGSLEVKIRKGSFFDHSSLTHRQILKRATSSLASTNSSNAPLSVYRNSSRPTSRHSGDLSRKPSLKIKTFRATDIPDPRNSPDLSAHPANSLPGSPVHPLSGSPIISSLDSHPIKTPSRPVISNASEQPTRPTPNPSLPLRENSTNPTGQAPAINRETTDQNYGRDILEKFSRNLDDHHSYSYDSLTKESVFATVQHCATGAEGKVIKIPDALGECLSIFKEREPKTGVAAMGWE